MRIEDPLKTVVYERLFLSVGKDSIHASRQVDSTHSQGPVQVESGINLRYYVMIQRYERHILSIISLNVEVNNNL